MKNSKKYFGKEKGFTLIELLVVIAIIAILSTVVMAGLNSARQKGRDAKRISDVKAVQSALELAFDTCGSYPSVDTLATISAAGGGASVLGPTTPCGGGTMAQFMAQGPVAPTPPAGNIYQYCSSTAVTPTIAATGCAANGTNYLITFTLEGVTGGVAAGAHSANASGINPGNT